MAQYVLRLMLGLLVLPSLWLLPAHAQDVVSIIPMPRTVEPRVGKYIFPAVTPLYAFDSFTEVAGLLAEHPHVAFGEMERIKSHKRVPDEGVRLVEARAEDRLPADAYRMVVDSNGILLVAHDRAAMINGILTLLQLAYTLPDGRELPAMLIEDRPRFGYRGLHLDVSTHFYPVPFLKKLIDLMALYKFNRFHWHLTDGPAWRLEIKRFPELTQKAAWRTHAAWKDWRQYGSRYLNEGHPNAHGGYYSQDEARELVGYAARKGITIVPEIKMPGHSDAVLAVYPHLSCSGEPYRNSEFCIGSEETFTFLTGVLDEVMAIFPSEYIHIGGDGVNKDAWTACAICSARMEKEGLKNVEGLQSYAVHRIADYLRSKGRKPVGWDASLQGGLPEGATVMSWSGEEGGSVQAANAGHDVIMTPGSHLDFDHYQYDPETQPEAKGGYIPLRQVYEYEPAAEGIADDKRKHIIGVQGNIWTEYLQAAEQVEYMAFPRAIALAEVAWSDPANRNWENFLSRLRQHYRLLQRLHVNYASPPYTVDIAVRFNPDTFTNTVSITTGQLEPGIRYTIDGQDPTARSPRYTKPIELAVPATVKAAYFIDSARVGPIDSAKADIHKAIGKSVVYQTTWDTYAGDGVRTLVNGHKGGKHADGGQWQGFKNNMDVTIDLERREEVTAVALNFLHDTTSQAYLPGEVKVLISDNGKNFREVSVSTEPTPTDAALPGVKTYNVNFDASATCRYLRVVATNVRHRLLLTDEIVVY